MWKRIAVLWTVVKHDVRLLWFALQHPQAPGWLKWAAIGLVAYVLSPVDFIPDMLPIVGWLDDAVLVPLVMRWLIGRLPAHVRAAAERRSRGERPAEAEVIDVR